jgi:O-antigen ligase
VSHATAIGGPRPLHASGGRGATAIRGRKLAEAPRSVRAALYIFVATIPFEAVPIADVLAGRFSLARMTGLLFFLMALFHAGTALRRAHAAVWWLLLWIVAVAAHLPFQRAYLSPSLVHVVQMSQMLLLLWVASNVLRSPRAWRTTLIVLICACTALAVVQALGGVSLNEGVNERTTTMSENPNTVGTMFALAIVAAIGLVREIVAGMPRVWLLLACIPLALQLVRTGSRAGMLALVVGLLIMMVRSRGFGGKAKATLVAVPLLLAFALVIASSESARGRMMQIIEERRFARREMIVPLAIEMIRERPVFGWGPETHLRELGSRMNRDSMDEHNLVLWVLNEGGLVAFIPFLIAIVLVVRDADRARHVGRGTVGLALVATLAFANMAHSYHNRKITWIVLAVAISTPRLRRVARGSTATRPPAAAQQAAGAPA